MTTVSVAHVFYGIYMGWSYNSLLDVMQKVTGRKTPDKGEIALFVNKGFTAVKLLSRDGALLYSRPQNGKLSVESIRCLPTLFGGQRLAFSRNLEANLIKAFETKQGQGRKLLAMVQTA